MIQASTGPCRVIAGNTSLAHLGQHPLVRPFALADEMQQRLMLCRRPRRRRHRRHRLHALAFARQHQPRAIVAQRTDPILVADHGRKTFDIGRKPRFTPNGADENHLSPLMLISDLGK